MADIISLPPGHIEEARARRARRVSGPAGIFGNVANLKRLIDRLLIECARLEAMRDPADAKTRDLLHRARTFARGHLSGLEALERAIEVAAPANENDPSAE